MSGTGNLAPPEIPPDHTSSSAARFTGGAASPHTPHNPEEERTPAARVLLQDIRRCFQQASTSENNWLVPKSSVSHF